MKGVYTETCLEQDDIVTRQTKVEIVRESMLSYYVIFLTGPSQGKQRFVRKNKVTLLTEEQKSYIINGGTEMNSNMNTAQKALIRAINNLQNEFGPCTYGKYSDFNEIKSGMILEWADSQGKSKATLRIALFFENNKVDYVILDGELRDIISSAISKTNRTIT